jgi:hypothetical protein
MSSNTAENVPKTATEGNAAAAEQQTPLTTTNAANVSAILSQIAKLEQHNQKLQNDLQSKSEEVNKLSEKKRQEMQHVYDTVISKWVDTLDTTKPESKDEFKSGMQRLAEKTEEDNGIWQVVMCASANAAKKEEQFQSLQKQYEELKERTEGGQFADEGSRVGSKRSALAPPEVVEDPEPPADIWSQFESYMKSEFKPSYVA